MSSIIIIKITKRLGGIQENNCCHEIQRRWLVVLDCQLPSQKVTLVSERSTAGESTYQACLDNTFQLGLEQGTSYEIRDCQVRIYTSKGHL